jgi:hypothetical protein
MPFMATSAPAFDWLGLVAMPVITVHEQVHQRARQDEDERKKREHVLTVVNPKVIPQRRGQAQKGQAQRGFVPLHDRSFWCALVSVLIAMVV